MGSALGPPVIGEVPDATLKLRKNADTQFSIEWWGADDFTDPVALTSAEAQVRTSALDEADVVLDLAPYITVEANVVTVLVPMAAVAPLDAMTGGWWDLIVTTATGERLAMLEGEATIVRGATR